MLKVLYAYPINPGLAFVGLASHADATLAILKTGDSPHTPYELPDLQQKSQDALLNLKGLKVKSGNQQPQLAVFASPQHIMHRFPG